MNQFTFKQNMEIDLTSLEIKGQRLNLMSISHAYTDIIFKEFTPAVARYMIPKAAQKIEETTDFIQSSLNAMNNANEIIFVILDASSKEFLGCCGFHGRGNCRTPELGLWLKVAAHGNGYGREAIYTLCKWALEHIEFDYAVYPVDRANIPSRRIPESLGGKIYSESIVETMSGRHLDEVIFKLPRQELVSRLASPNNSTK